MANSSSSFRDKRDKQNEKLNEMHATLTANQKLFEKDKRSLRMQTIVEPKPPKPPKKLKKKP
jgi:hypothetical protein